MAGNFNADLVDPEEIARAEEIAMELAVFGLAPAQEHERYLGSRCRSPLKPTWNRSNMDCLFSEIRRAVPTPLRR